MVYRTNIDTRRTGKPPELHHWISNETVQQARIDSESIMWRRQPNNVPSSCVWFPGNEQPYMFYSSSTPSSDCLLIDLHRVEHTNWKHAINNSSQKGHPLHSTGHFCHSRELPTSWSPREPTCSPEVVTRLTLPALKFLLVNDGWGKGSHSPVCNHSWPVLVQGSFPCLCSCRQPLLYAAGHKQA